MDIERLRTLEKAVELVAKATKGPWAFMNEKFDDCLLAFGTDSLKYAAPPPWYSCWTSINPDDGRALIAAVNFIREHGSALIAELGREVGAVADGLEFFAVPDDLHPETVNLVSRFAAALAEKLAIAQRKYGWDRHWQSPAWMDQCREQLVEHVAKGDPRDVAAYCAFLWHHGESTAMPTVEWTKDAEEYGSALNEAAWTFVGECPEKSALLFNNTKASLRAAILTYAQHVARATSPAHTSEARDAARYRWLAENAIIQWPGVTHIGDDPASTRLPLDNAIDAAMRQEGGNG